MGERAAEVDQAKRVDFQQVRDTSLLRIVQRKQRGFHHQRNIAQIQLINLHLQKQPTKRHLLPHLAIPNPRPFPAPPPLQPARRHRLLLRRPLHPKLPPEALARLLLHLHALETHLPAGIFMGRWVPSLSGSGAPPPKGHPHNPQLDAKDRSFRMDRQGANPRL